METSVIIYPPRPAKFANPDVCAEYLLAMLKYLCPSAQERFGPPDEETLRDILVNQPALNNTHVEPFYMVTGLNRNVAHTLRSQSIWSSKVGTFFVLPNPVPTPTFAVSIQALTCQDNFWHVLRNVIIDVLKTDPGVVNMITVGAAENDIHDQEGIDVLAKTTLDSVHIWPLRIPQGDNDADGYERRWNLYVNCPMHNDLHTNWVSLLRGIDYNKMGHQNRRRHDVMHLLLRN
ncbi:hypothetical protein PUNSTDRAFT_138117 [Punctularia strigosozonata HHB-11173 SS5]|uniref:Uncharacterized protein n=1 Tax=Punctularia strigosozonata (strain HHB-11173) TaxID=741275 RepID=R7S3Y9_PUNST|nr:uncharacterized protein PUNSTDRAFT_138117 [Punctularia strigosozonata HHB-11173 SS5]EIN04928.1 hypothetical protein PUNSTDRAFT_138117 [Punctularia strigosozonata HHB-11173 SS5]